MAHNKLYRNFIILQEDENKKSSSNEKALSGYAKIEAKGDKCKITFYAQNLKRDGDYSIVLICHKKDMKKIIDMGKINVNEVGKGEACKEYYVDNIAGLDMSYDKISGAGICKNINSDPIYLMYGFMNGEKPEAGWKKCKITKCAEEGSKAKTYTKKDSDKLKDKHKEKEEHKKDDHKEKDYDDHKKKDYDDHKKDDHKEKDCDDHKKDYHKEKDYDDHKKDDHKEKGCDDHKKDDHKEKEHHKDYELCEDGHNMKEYNKDDHKEKDCEDHKKKDHEEKEKKEHKEKDKKDKCNICREDQLINTLDGTQNNMSNNMSDGMQNNMLNNALDGTPNNMLNNTLDGTQNNMSNNMSDGMQNNMLNNALDGTPNNMLNNALDGTQNNMLNNMPDGMQNNMLNNALDGTPNNMLNNALDGTQNNMLNNALDGTQNNMLNNALDGTQNNMLNNALDGTQNNMLNNALDGTQNNMLNNTLDGTSNNMSDKFNDYEKEIARRIEEENIDPYDFKLRGGIGEFFEGLVQGFEEVKGKIKELKYCKWFKIPVLDIEDMCDASNRDRYSIIFYPMLNYYPYIRKHRHFMFGYKCDSKGDLKYLVYAIPGRRDRDDQPYGGKSGFVTWCRARGNDEMGYWLMFYDFKNSTIVVPSK
ncbi:hypothetical protein BH721_08970 [Clostridium baratii]|uniref:hypothetical protein n=1 Tax=Clostridium baratii TaxID=1561 RepID=UPI0009A2A604|nr:hypothetical protein [Clostridium baratii]OPF52975.1 hypothetical protein A1M12_00360 [Clostridium baratii]OPF53805.1 hypothetical protein BH721_08970 [Clostridium baratii]OPF54345.1 hypothetical protein BH724_02160 [Clostridium baratii]OPF60817.1 hypothetical protein BH725_00830 [Clostridium baratii]